MGGCPKKSWLVGLFAFEVTLADPSDESTATFECADFARRFNLNIKKTANKLGGHAVISSNLENLNYLGVVKNSSCNAVAYVIFELVRRQVTGDDILTAVVIPAVEDFEQDFVSPV